MRRPPEFHVGNLLSPSSYASLETSSFDVVAMQLAIHYMMESPEQASLLLTQVSRLLVPGGVFIGSTLCCDKIAEKIAHLQAVPLEQPAQDDGDPILNAQFEYRWGNPIVSTSFDLATLRRIAGHSLDGDSKQKGDAIEEWTPRTAAVVSRIAAEKFRKEWGFPYRFWLAESINASEFTVPWTAFCTLAAQKFNLICEMHMTFPNFLRCAEQARTPRLVDWLRRNTHLKFDADQVSAFEMYKVFIFRKPNTEGFLQFGDKRQTDSAPGLFRSSFHVDQLSKQQAGAVTGGAAASGGATAAEPAAQPGRRKIEKTERKFASRPVRDVTPLVELDEEEYIVTDGRPRSEEQQALPRQDELLEEENQIGQMNAQVKLAVKPPTARKRAAAKRKTSNPIQPEKKRRQQSSTANISKKSAQRHHAAFGQSKEEYGVLQIDALDEDAPLPGAADYRSPTAGGGNGRRGGNSILGNQVEDDVEWDAADYDPSRAGQGCGEGDEGSESVGCAIESSSALGGAMGDNSPAIGTGELNPFDSMWVDAAGALADGRRPSQSSAGTSSSVSSSLSSTSSSSSSVGSRASPDASSRKSCDESPVFE
eukprot:GHVT01076443.1.p1 GENE.GHVT01076443.1~~GHVT01076443.1.p1  ORF type:complete len:593 (+),score=114.16 GHVT01076443.1:592-2370(+)